MASSGAGTVRPREGHRRAAGADPRGSERSGSSRRLLGAVTLILLACWGAEKVGGEEVVKATGAGAW